MTAKNWATPPIDMEQAAAALGISRRTLTDAIKGLPFFELRGRKKVFYPEHIASLRREMHQCASRSNGLTAGRTFTALDPMASASDALSKLEILAKQRKRGHR